MTDRDELIHKIEIELIAREVPFTEYQDGEISERLLISKLANCIVNVCIADRKAILDRITEPLREAKYEIVFNGCWEPTDEFPSMRAIEESLNLADEMKGNV